MTVGDLVELLSDFDSDLELLGNYDGNMVDGPVFAGLVHAAEDGDGVYRPKVQGFGKDYIYVC